MSRGVGMTDGLLRKAGTGPGRFTLPVVRGQKNSTEGYYRDVMAEG